MKSNYFFKKITRIFLFLILLSCFSLIFIEKVKAQEKINESAISVGPAILEKILTPGEINFVKVVVSNISNFPLPIKSSVKNFLPKEEVSLNEISRYDASSWIYLEPTDFILQPKENKEILVRIETPIDASPGGHYATLYFEPLVAVVALSPQTAYSLARVGVLTFLVVKGEITEKAVLQTIKVKKFLQSGPINIDLAVKNEGNVHLLPSAKIFITDWRGEEVTVLNSQPAMVLPDTVRDLVFMWDKKYPIGKFWLKGEVIFGNEQEKISLSGFSFWVLPIIPLLIPISLLTTIIIITILKRRRFILAFRILFAKKI